MGIAHPNPSRIAIPKPVIEIEPAAVECAIIPTTSKTDPIRARRDLWDISETYRIYSLVYTISQKKLDYLCC